MAPSWDEEIRELVRTLPSEHFALADIYAYQPLLEAQHPNNFNIRAKIRQTLQHLRRSGEVEFVDGRGSYRRLPIAGPALEKVGESEVLAYPEVGVPDRVPLEQRAPSTYVVRPASAKHVLQREQSLVRAWAEELSSHGHPTQRWRIPTNSNSTLFTDVYDEASNVLYEAKGIATRDSVRLAIGQILDYRRYLTDVNPSLSLLLPDRPSEDMVNLLAGLGMGLVYLTTEGFKTEIVPG